ncbi:MAG TPA: hypothetical protein VFE34_09395 [Dongiaceae bacterium]|jgi:hypothetical protein|nr:hypothetical protein [Dongiaceae bacterium]
MTEVAPEGISGVASLIEWFGRVRRFHDAKILDIALHSDEPSVIRIHAWQELCEQSS